MANRTKVEARGEGAGPTSIAGNWRNWNGHFSRVIIPMCLCEKLWL